MECLLCDSGSDLFNVRVFLTLNRSAFFNTMVPGINKEEEIKSKTNNITGWKAKLKLEHEGYRYPYY